MAGDAHAAWQFNGDSLCEHFGRDDFAFAGFDGEAELTPRVLPLPLPRRRPVGPHPVRLNGPVVDHYGIVPREHEGPVPPGGESRSVAGGAEVELDGEAEDPLGRAGTDQDVAPVRPPEVGKLCVDITVQPVLLRDDAMVLYQAHS